MAKSKSKSLDDLLSDMRERNHGKLEESFKHYERVTDEDNLNALALDMFQPAMDDFYTTFAKEMDTIGLKDDKSIKTKKKKDVQGAAVTALKAFFEKTRPSVLKALEGVTDVEEQYRILTREYNEQVGIGGSADSPGISAIIENYIGNKNAKAGQLKKHLYSLKSDHVDSSVTAYKNRAYQHFIGTYQAPEVAAHLGKRAKKKGLEITDQGRFISLPHDSLFSLHHGINTGDYGRGGHKAYGLREKEKKKKD